MPEPWAPTAADVKAEIPMRLNGAAFGAATSPTEAQVLTLVDGVAAELVAFIPEPITAEHYALAKAATAVETAARIERKFWPEQQGDDESQYDLLHEDYLKRRRDLYRAITGDEPPGEGDEESTPIPNPTGTFPTATDLGGALTTEEYYPLGKVRF